MKRISKIVTYSRLSKPKKGKEDTSSLEAQWQAIHRFAEEPGVKIISKFNERRHQS